MISSREETKLKLFNAGIYGLWGRGGGMFGSVSMCIYVSNSKMEPFFVFCFLACGTRYLLGIIPRTSLIGHFVGSVIP